VEGRYLPQYWLFLEAKADAGLKNLDGFLRDIWLECCGHMSSFQIGQTEYGEDPDGDMGLKSMKISLDKVLQVGTEFFHQYDFGSTTELALKVVSERQAHGKSKTITLLARNNPPIIACQLCGKQAAQICTECLWSDEISTFCDKCAESHECGDDMFLPIVNSPRVGVCGYTG
jgi:hypothetical protein